MSAETRPETLLDMALGWLADADMCANCENYTHASASISRAEDLIRRAMAKLEKRNE